MGRAIYERKVPSVSFLFIGCVPCLSPATTMRLRLHRLMSDQRVLMSDQRV